MNWISSSTARRRTANAAFRSRGGPQMPSPVRRIAPKPSRCTDSSPPSKTFPAKLAETSFLFMTDLQLFRLLFESVTLTVRLHLRQRIGFAPYGFQHILGAFQAGARNSEFLHLVN